MSHYVTRPTEIEAIQIKKTNWKEILDFVPIKFLKTLQIQEGKSFMVLAEINHLDFISMKGGTNQSIDFMLKQQLIINPTVTLHLKGI